MTGKSVLFNGTRVVAETEADPNSDGVKQQYVGTIIAYQHLISGNVRYLIELDKPPNRLSFIPCFFYDDSGVKHSVSSNRGVFLDTKVSEIV